MEASFYSHGKLLLSAEYAVLDGALALAVPTKKGQSLHVSTVPGRGVIWESKTPAAEVWYTNTFVLNDGKVGSQARDKVSEMLVNLLERAMELNPGFLRKEVQYRVTTSLEFDRNWGLGSSSTLLNNIAQWAGVDPYALLKTTFGGSGYDLAAASMDTPFTYQLLAEGRSIKPVRIEWPFTEELFFVHLNQKQDSRKAIEQYRGTAESGALVGELSDITRQMLQCLQIASFEDLLERHERILSKRLGMPPVKKRLFKDYPGAIKSLGGWGGDFILVTGTPEKRDYFRQRGFQTIIGFREMLL